MFIKDEATKALVLRGLNMLQKSLKRKADDDTLSPAMSQQYTKELQDVAKLSMDISVATEGKK